MKTGVVIIAVLLAVLTVGFFWFQSATQRNLPQAEPAPTGTETAPENAPGRKQSSGQTQPPTKPQTAETRPQPPAPKPKGFCERDFGDVAAREADATGLQAAGGLVHIFEREAQLQDPYGCADFYLQHGLAINAVDPRPDRGHLTGLFFAIKRNDPKMLRFMLDHGADLKKRAGKNDTKAMGYAYYLALNDTRIDRNKVISMLDRELTRQTDRADNSNASGANNSP